jgi:hypothetical protein
MGQLTSSSLVSIISTESQAPCWEDSDEASAGACEATPLTWGSEVEVEVEDGVSVLTGAGVGMMKGAAAAAELEVVRVRVAPSEEEPVSPCFFSASPSSSERDNNHSCIIFPLIIPRWGNLLKKKKFPY